MSTEEENGYLDGEAWIVYRKRSSELSTKEIIDLRTYVMFKDELK